MNLTLRGVALTPDLRGWDNTQRRMGSLLAIGAVALVVLVGLTTYAFAGESGSILYWILVALAVLVLAFEAAILTLGVRSETHRPRAVPSPAAGPGAPQAPAQDPSPWAPPPEARAPPAAPAPGEILTLRCGDCGTVFDVADTGERPLYHKCPGCDAEGVLRDLPAARAPAAPAPRPPPAQPKPQPPAPPAPKPQAPQPKPQPKPVQREPLETRPAPEPVPVALRRLRLRCGGCKDIFVIEDTGERPLRRVCPHCGRTGEIR